MNKYKMIQRLCKERGYSVAQMERDLKFARGSIAKIDDHKPSMEKVAKICSYLNVSTDMLLGGSMNPVEKADEQVYEISAGQGRINEESDRYEPLNGRIAKVVGDSMLPSLRDGDYVNIVETSDVTPKDYAVVRINGDEMTIKHVEFTEDGVWIRGENKEVFEDKFYSIKDIVLLPVQVVGKATAIVQRKL